MTDNFIDAIMIVMSSTAARRDELARSLCEQFIRTLGFQTFRSVVRALSAAPTPTLMKLNEMRVSARTLAVESGSPVIP